MSFERIEEVIQECKIADERAASDRAWELRADAIRKRELFTNLSAIRDAAKRGFDRLSAGLLDRRLEFTIDPARRFVLRNSSISGVTVNVSMELDGAVLTIETTRHYSPNEAAPSITDTVRVEVEGNSTYYLHHGKRVTVLDIADIILEPLLESLRKRRSYLS
jgi:hypothetical protein